MVNRLGTIWEALDEGPAPSYAAIEVENDDSQIRYEGLTLRAGGKDDKVLVRDLNAQIPQGRGGGGARPPPPGPYTALGSLRDQFFDADYQGVDDDERLISVLCQVTFGPILERVGGLDVERDWANILTVGEQQLLGIARLLMAEPKYAVLDRATSALSLSRVKHVYTILSATPITYLTVGDHPVLRNYHDNALELLDDGEWSFGPAKLPD